MKIIEQISNYIAKYFGSNANFYVKQISDGSYRKTAGTVNAALVKSVITNRQSIACYQRNIDHTINWICFDFDILKVNIGTDKQNACEVYLLQTARRFIDFLKLKSIHYSLEFSGNRGIHVWINLDSPIFPYIGFEVVKYLMDNSGISIDRTMIGLDLFPSSASHKSSHGKAVKIPLSRHTKSGCYSVLITEIPNSFSAVRITDLDEDVMLQQLNILRSQSRESITSIEEKLGVEFENNDQSDVSIDRVKKIFISAANLGFDELVEHWLTIPLVAALATDMKSGTLSHARRQLLVGLLGRIVNSDGEEIGRTMLVEIFSRMRNYNEEKTKSALFDFLHLPFPNLEIVESLCNFTYHSRIDTAALALLLIPNAVLIDDGLFTISEIDLTVTTIAERNYLYQNDEVRCLRVIEEMANVDYQLMAGRFERFVSGVESIEMYRHKRKEIGKENFRELVTLSATPRLFSTWAIKHLIYIYNYEPSPNSYGYKMNRNFAGGHIFKPWLYQWIEFLSDIADVINNELYLGHYIVKADIKSFYNTIPHDNLERMLLTGFDNEIAIKLESMQTQTADRYRKIVGALNKITKECNPERKGVPQGPAYARVFAELYLAQIDELMDGLLASGEILFYHRYVDDIFFVVATRADAEDKLNDLKTRLSLLGLSLNPEKTNIAKIENFDDDFNNYRAQAKYAIDAISSNINSATPHEKNIALLEYNKLISQQDKNDDAVFLFSHLTGFAVADRYRDKAVNVLVENRVGRGNLFKHVFIYLLNSSHLWQSFSLIHKLTELQSEVFTSVCVDILSDQREATPSLKEFIEAQLPKLTETDLVNEHKVYLQLYFNVGAGIDTLNPIDVLKCIRTAENPDRFFVDEAIVRLTESSLNAVTDIGELVSYLCPMCVHAETNQAALSALAKIFSAKLSNDIKNKRLNLVECDQLILTRYSARAYYQLLCLFTLSKTFHNQSMLETAWEFCATIFNTFRDISSQDRKASWYKNFDYIEVNHSNLNLAVTSITEGTIWRGAPDVFGIYANYHNALMVLVLTGEKNQTMDEVRAALEKVQDVGIFYQWLFSENVDLFPSRKWFIENLTRNDCILLYRNSQILIRKRVGSFTTRDAIADVFSRALTGYADLVVPYVLSSHKSIFEIISCEGNFFTNLKVIKNIILQYSVYPSKAPNFFSQSRMLTREEGMPFSDEIKGTPYLILENNEKIYSTKNNFANFIQILFSLVELDQSPAYSTSTSSMTLSHFHARYINNLDSQREVPDFLRRLDILFTGSEHICDEVSFDLTVASALYSITDLSEAIPAFWRIKSFFDKYNKIHRSSLAKHIYLVRPDLVAKKLDLQTFFDGLLAPLDNVAEYRPDLPIAINRDLREYQSNIAEMVLEISPTFSLSDFAYSSVTQSLITEKISIDGRLYSYENVFVVNPAGGLTQAFSSEHVFLLQSSEDIFSKTSGNDAFIFLSPKELTISFSDIVDRQNYFHAGDGSPPNYWPYVQSEDSISELDIDSAANIVSVHRDISLEEARQRLKYWLRYIPEQIRQPMIWLVEAHEIMRLAEIKNFRMHFDTIRSKRKNPIIFKRFRDFGGVHRLLADNLELARGLDDHGPDSLPASATEATIFADIGLSGGQIVSALDYYLSVGEIVLDKIYFCNSDAARRKVGESLRKLASINLCFVLFTDECIAQISSCLLRHGLSPTLQVSNGRNISSSAFLGTSQKLSARKKAAVISFLLNTDLMDHLMKRVFSTNGATRKFQKGKLTALEKINLVSRYQSMPKKSLDFLTADLIGSPGTALFERVRELTEAK